MDAGHTHDTDDCRMVADVLSRIGDKWTVYVVRILSDGSMRFNEIKRAIPAISQRMLTLTLLHLPDHPAARGLRADGSGAHADRHAVGARRLGDGQPS